MREPLLVYIITYNIIHVVHYSRLIIKKIINKTYVKMCASRRQCAWLINKQTFSSHQRLNEEHLNVKNNRALFEQWLVGFTDGDGNFHISRTTINTKTGNNSEDVKVNSNKWGLSYKLTQSAYNLRVLNYIKKELKVGSITKDNTKAQYFIRDRKVIEKLLLPIFDKYPLLTTKYFDYIKLKQALLVLNDISLTRQDKDIKLLKIKDMKPNTDYISPAWNNANLPLTNVSSINNVMSNSWLVGFIEAEGSFYLSKKTSTRMVHAFGLTQKLDKVVLEAIAIKLHIKTQVRYKVYHNYYILDTTNSRAIENIISFFKNTMKGVKSLEYRIWARSYAKNKGNFEKLYEIRNIIRKLRKAKYS